MSTSFCWLHPIFVRFLVSWSRGIQSGLLRTRKSGSRISIIIKSASSRLHAQERQPTHCQSTRGSGHNRDQPMESKVQRCAHMEAHSTCELVDDLVDAHEDQPKSRGHHTHA